jgi:homoserine acetyltransferase
VVVLRNGNVWELYPSCLMKRISSLSRSFSSYSFRSSQFNPPAFPCVDQNESRSKKILSNTFSSNLVLGDYSAKNFKDSQGPEPAYNLPKSYNIYSHSNSFPLAYSPNPLPSFELAYETWGKLNKDKSNAILLHTGLSASSHAKSNELNPDKGWWEKFIGPGKALDTNELFIICCNVLGGCYGSTGPSSKFPVGEEKEDSSERWGTRFPLLSLHDIVRAQFHLLDHLEIDKLYASVGSSMGGMSSISSAHLFPDRVGKIVSISGTGRSSPSAIALRYAQRSGMYDKREKLLIDTESQPFGIVLMADPNWNRGFYYDKIPPHTGMKLARRE